MLPSPPSHVRDRERTAPEPMPAHFEGCAMVAVAHRPRRALYTAAEAVVHELGACAMQQPIVHSASHGATLMPPLVAT